MGIRIERRQASEIPADSPAASEKPYWVPGLGMVQPRTLTGPDDHIDDDFFAGDQTDGSFSTLAISWATVDKKKLVSQKTAFVPIRHIPSWSMEGKRLSPEEKKGQVPTITKISDHQYVVDSSDETYVVNDTDGDYARWLEHLVKVRGGEPLPSEPTLPWQSTEGPRASEADNAGGSLARRTMDAYAPKMRARALRLAVTGNIPSTLEAERARPAPLLGGEAQGSPWGNNALKAQLAARRAITLQPSSGWSRLRLSLQVASTKETS